MSQVYIKLFLDYLDAIEPLGDAERGRLFTALLEYARTGEAPQLGGNERFIFPMMRAQIDRDNKAAQELSQIRSNARTGGKQMMSNETNDIKSHQMRQDKDKDKDKEEDKDKDKNNGDTDVSPTSRQFPDDSDEMKLSRLLFERMRKNNPKCREPNFQAWCKHVDLLLRVDGRTPKEVQDVIVFCQKDGFWQSNILSTKKLREKFDQLSIKMRQGQPARGNAHGASPEAPSSYDMDKLEALIEKGGLP